MNSLTIIWFALANKAEFLKSEQRREDEEKRIAQERERRGIPYYNDPLEVRLEKLRKGLLYSALITAVALFLAAIGWYFVPLPPARGAIAVIAGTVVILWSTLALRGWDIQSFGGNTLAEQVNLQIFRSSYFIGTLLIVYGTLSAIT